MVGAEIVKNPMCTICHIGFFYASYYIYKRRRRRVRKTKSDNQEFACQSYSESGTEELGHLEIVGSLVSQLSKNAPPKEWTEMGSWEYYSDNGASVFPQSSQGSPFNAASIAVTGDPLTNLYEDLAAEQKARAVYDNILRLSDDPDVNEVIKFLRQREIVHFQRFGEAILTLSNRFFESKT